MCCMELYRQTREKKDTKLVILYNSMKDSNMKCQIVANLFYALFTLRKDVSKPVRAYPRNVMSNITKVYTTVMLELPT